ncbi:hypothetical protein EAG_03361 [Camponotus floridanus]|uniref:Ig-like domain-containing protein n=1 Tax=Camponotus floridanus TaxID=104421 RepID=E2AAJ8_CAMFO|nr:hypothetical protein EAG_03361 [Camponotus floridanus]
MRIVFLVVFYIATYVAGIADDGETTNIMPGNGIKHILRQKSEAIQDKINEKFIDDKITREINKHRRQSLLINRIDSLSQNRKILNGKLTRAKRSLQKRKKRAKNSDIAHHPNVFQNNDVDDDIDKEEEEENLSKTRGLPIWQISEPMVAAIDLNSTTNPMIVKQTEMINRSSFKRPRSENLKSYRVSKETSSLIATDQHSNSHGLFDTNVPDKNLVFSKFSNSKSNRRSPVFKKLDKVPLFAYPPEISVDIDSNFKPSRGFEWRGNGYLKNFSNLRNNQEDLSDSHLTDSNERFLLVPVSKDLYVLKSIQDSPSVNGMIIPKHKLLERNKNKGNISAILSLKAHMHHDVKDVGRAYLHHRASNNHYLSDYNTNYLYTDLEPRVIEENKTNITPLSYPNFLYPGIAPQTLDVIDVPEILDPQIPLRVPDYKHISFVDIDSNTKIVPYDSTTASTAPFFDMSKYDVSSYPKENTNDRKSNVLPTKLNELNSRLDSENDENSLEYSDTSIQSTDFPSTFDSLDVINTDKSRINFIDDISTPYRSAFDASNQDNFFSSQFLLNNIENILNNQDTNEDYIGSEIITLSEYNDKKSTFNDFNYDNKFIDETLFSNYTTIKLDSFLNIENHTTSISLPSDTDEWSLKKKQSNVGNPRALLNAIEPLSSELKKLLTAVKLVNQSISNVQNRLCDKKNIVRSARIERESKERKATNIAKSIYSKDDFDPFMKNFNNQSLDKKKIKIKDKNIVDRISNDIEFKRKTINDYFLNKLTTPLQKRESSISNNRKILNNRNFLKKRKLSESKFFKLDNIEKHRLPLKFNRNLKSLIRNYKVQAKPIRQLVESRLKRVIRKTTPVIISSHGLLKNNILSKNNFINRLTQKSPKNKSTSLSRHNTLSIFSDIIADKDNRMNFLSNNKRDLARYNITNKLSSDTENKYSSVDPQSYREVTAYLDILRLLNMTKKPFIESLISTTESSATTASILPIEYPIERSTTIAWRTTIAWGKESPEVTESVLYEYLTGTDYEYYEQNYTGIYEDYGYEDRGNVTSWYDYVEETTAEKMEIIATTIKHSIPTFVEIMEDFEITTPTKKKIDYEVVETISLTGLSVTLSAFTVTMPTTQLYTTELSIFPIDTEVFTTEIIEETVAMPIEITETSIIIPTVILTTESVMLLTPFLEGMTDITLKITIPTVTSTTSIEEAPIITEKEIVESTVTILATEITQSFLTETSTSLFIISTVSLFTAVETAELTIQITTPIVPILTPLTVMEKLRTTTSIEKPASVTERMITGTSSTIISTESTVILGKKTTLQAVTSKITYVTKIQTRIEDVISFTTQALTFATHIPTSTSEITEETSLVTEKIKTTSIENTTEITHVTTLPTTRFAPTVQVTESTTETLITTSKIIITTTTSSPTTLERTETILSTTEKITTLTPEEEESPVTQIEKTITAEETTTTETPTTIGTVMTTEMISETSMSSTTPTIEVSSTTSTLLTTIETTVTKFLTPSEILTITGSLPIENRTITKPPTTIGISTLIPTTTEIPTTIETLTITETIESTSTSSVIPVSVTTIKTVLTTLLITTKRPTVKTTIPITSLKLMTTTTIANITLRETPNTTISSTFLTTIVPTTASVKTTVPITSVKLTTTTLLSLVTNTTLSETPCTISTTFLTEEIETSTTTFSMTSATISTTKILPTLSTLITTSSFLNTSVAINRTFFTTIFTTFKTAIIETTTLSMTPVTTTSPFETTTLIPSTVKTNTTLSEITFSTLSTEMIESTAFTTVSLTEIVSTTSLIELITEERTTWITTERTTIMKATTLMTYLPLSTTMFFIETTTETTLFVIETVTPTSSEEISTIKEVTAVSFTTIIEESSLIEEITDVISTTVEISIPTKITLMEKSTISAIETSIANTSLAPIVMTTVSLLSEATTETTSLTTTGTFLSITEELEQTTLLKTEMTFTPPSEFTPSILITSETPATTSEAMSVLPKTVSEGRELTTTLTSPLITYTLETFTALSIERTTVSTVAATKEMPEAETEYYVAKEPFYEEEYEEYEEYEIPTDKWYYYEEYETTTKSKTTMASSTIKYTKLFKETSPFFLEGTTSSYETKTLEFTMYSTTSMILSFYTSKIPYIEEFTSALETSTMTVIENRTTIEVETEFITSITSKEEESTTIALTFGSTEEYTLLPSTAFEIITKPLEYLTIPAKYTESTSKFLTEIWYAPKFTKPEEISEIELEKTSTSERIFTETEFIEEKLISFFVSSTLTTLSEREAIGVTTASIAFSEMETAIEIAYEVTTLATTTVLITKEEIALYTTMFITPEIETELITMRKTTIGREEEKKQLQQLLDDLEQREREVMEREERLKEKERKWEEKKHEEMMQREKEKAKNITIITDTTASYETSTVPVEIVSTENLTVASTAKIKVTSLVFDTSSLAEIATTSTETEEGIFATYFTEKTKEVTTQEIFSTYIVEVTETAILYTTEESTSVTYVTKEIEEIYVTNYIIPTSYITASIVDIYNISLVSIETTTPYTIEEIYTTSYGTIYLSEPLFTTSTMVFTSPITLVTDEFITLSTATFRISSYEIGTTSIPIPTPTKERYITSCVTLCSEFPFISPTMTLTGRITTAIGITILPIPVTTPISYTQEIIDVYSELFTSSASEFINTTTALAISTIMEIEYDEEIESLKEKLREKERELKEREKILLEKEERLKKNIIEFELYMKEIEKEVMHTLTTSSLSTPVPPTEKTTVKTQVTTIKKIIERKENQTTTKMATSQHETTRVTDIEEKERTRHVPGKTTTQVEEIVTKKICLNVLENTTIPFVIKKMCLPYLPERKRKQNYNKDKETYEVISANPSENELTVIMSESNDDNTVNKFGDEKITTPYHELEEKNDLQEENDRQEEEDDSFEDILENYMNYEEHTTSIPIRDDKFLDRDDDESKMKNKTILLDQMWPTEKSTTYHLGGTRFWELDVTEPSGVLSIPTDTSKAIDVSVSRTTVSFSLDEIKALNCSIYKETQDKIVISIDSDAEETREFSQPHYNTESLKGQKYIKLEELEDDFKSDLDLGNDHDIVSLPGVNLNLPCNQDSDGITWLSTISRPSYMWKRTDGIAIFGFVAENGDLELRNVNAKDTGNYTCVTTYVGPETEEPVETTYEVRLQVVTLPRYIVHGESRYYTRSCDERDLDILVTYLPVKLNDIICEADICNAYILTPSCSRNQVRIYVLCKIRILYLFNMNLSSLNCAIALLQITINILLLPSHIVKLMTIDPKRCNVICLKGIQDKLSLILSKNLQIFLGKTIPCHMDTYSEDGISYCKKCPPGTYQPNHGARVCRTCTDPLTKGCHNMLWSSFSAIMITLASLSVMLSIFLLFLWIICCAKKKFCIKKIASIIPKADTFEQEDPIEEQSLIKDVSENQDQQWDNEYKAKKKKKKFYLNKKRRKQNERGKYEKMRIYEDEWGSHRIKNTPIVCPDSYRSHEDYNNYYSKQSYRKGPRLPECDFDT